MCAAKCAGKHSGTLQLPSSRWWECGRRGEGTSKAVKENANLFAERESLKNPPRGCFEVDTVLRSTFQVTFQEQVMILHQHRVSWTNRTKSAFSQMGNAVL